ncbi:zinc-ribbon domain-containing protein, partial [Salmonella enterica subsp. enterica serovar Give]|nr:zinc-ribbon domain-containing protein [Salmonella enterica subsp. enterica serovar Give]
MAIIKCPECGRQISDKAPTCPSCGVEIAGKITKCPHCGEVYFSSQEMCPNCHEIAVGVTHPVASSAAVKDLTPVAPPSPVSSPAS